MNASQRSPEMQNESTPARRGSVILHTLHRFSAWLYACILNSWIGRLLTDDRATRQALSEGRLHHLVHSRRKRSDRVFFRFCHAISSALEKSFFGRLLDWLKRALLHTGLSSYGVFFLFFGCYSVVVYYVMGGLGLGQVDISYALTGGSMILLSLPMFASSHSLAYTMRKSMLSKAVLVGVLGVAEERLRSYEDRGREHYLEALVLAILSGSLTFVIAPHRLLLIAAAVLVLWMIFRDPEIGLLLSVGAAPFLMLGSHPTLALAALVGISLLSYGMKLLRGKRMLRMEATDWTVLLLLALFMFGGIFTHGGRASLYSALVYACFGAIYFMVANLIRSQSGVYRLLLVLLVGGGTVAALGVWQYVFSTPALEYLDLTLFADLGGRVASVWGNPNILAEHIALLLPLGLVLVLLSRRLLPAFGSAVCFGMMGACLVFTWTRGAWLGAIASLLLFVLLLHHRALTFTLIGTLPVVALAQFAPDQIQRRFSSIGTHTDSSVLYRYNLWEGVQRMLSDHWIGGVGVGESAFRAVYAGYALPGIETAMHAHSLYLGLLSSLGVMGLAVFALVLFFWVQRALSYLRYGQLRTPRLIVLGGLTGIAALLVMGFFDDVWYNYSIYMLFWTVMGLVSAQIRVGEQQTERAYNPVEDERTQGEIVLRFE